MLECAQWIFPERHITEWRRIPPENCRDEQKQSKQIEIRDCLAQNTEEPQTVVGPAVLHCCSNDPKGRSKEHSETEDEDHYHGSDREASAEFIADGRSAQVSSARIKADHPGQPIDVALKDWPVEPMGAMEVVYLFLLGLLSYERQGRVAGSRAMAKKVSALAARRTGKKNATRRNV